MTGIDLFEQQKRQKLSPVVDRINDRHGRDAIGFGLLLAPNCGRNRLRIWAVARSPFAPRCIKDLIEERLSAPNLQRRF
jgi:hypothetical protein